MKEIHKVEYMPEVGDSVFNGDVDSEGTWTGTKLIGKISAICQHCGACQPYANIVSKVPGGERVVACPDIDDMEWDAKAGHWILTDSFSPLTTEKGTGNDHAG